MAAVSSIAPDSGTNPDKGGVKEGDCRSTGLLGKGMIEAAEDILVRDEMPASKAMGGFSKLVKGVFAPVLRRWRKWRCGYLMRSVAAPMLRAAGKCETRTELEGILGKPKFALRNGRMRTSEEDNAGVLTEVYEARGCVFFLNFREGRLENMSGSVEASLWDYSIERVRRRAFLLKSREERFLRRGIDMDSFAEFLKRYLSYRGGTDTPWELRRFIEHLDERGMFRTLGDLKEVIDKTNAAFGVFSREMRCASSISDFETRYFLMHKDERRLPDTAGRAQVDGEILALFEKYEHLVERE